MKTFIIIKKNRKYFAATLDGYDCKLIIDSNSQHLEPGEHTLDVEDLSVRTKYGTDLVFKVKAEVNEICSLRAAYNEWLVQECRKLGGKFMDGAWIFPKYVENEIEELDFVYNSELVTLEITAKDDISEYHGRVDFLGYPIAEAKGRDSGAELRSGAALLKGRISSGGSVKNWATVVKEGTTLRLQVPVELLALHQDDTANVTERWSIKKL